MAKVPQENPSVTVIIPMYNAEKYIGQCLQSLVNQTFQDFDVIVVNDCSTDNSLAEVKKFTEHFQGRLKVKTLSKNTGASAIPKNTAIQMARGKYLTFLDSDDYITPTAIEEIFKIAEETDADIIHCSHYFAFNDGENKISKGTFQRTNFVDKPTLETMDIAERVKKFTEYGFLWWGCSKLIRRDFLIKNKIQFPTSKVWEDMIFAFQCIVCAKNYVRVPNVFYYYRLRNDSLSHVPKTPAAIIRTMVNIVSCLDKFMGQNEFFKQNPQYRFMVIDWHLQERIGVLSNAVYVRDKLAPYHMDQLFSQEMAADIPRDILPFVSYFFSLMGYQRCFIQQTLQEKNQLQQKIAELEAQLAQNK